MADQIKSTERIVVDLDVPERYVVEHEIARGGMGIVYAAHHKISGQKLAIKVLKEAVASDPTNLKRFKLEATAIAKLNHPNIIRLIDFGVTDSGAAFMVTEFIDGASLKEKIETSDGLTSDDFYSIMLQACDALISAHSHGIIHRDIKPSNILLNADGTARLSDFGIARLVDPESKDHTLTGTGEIIGSPQYMSPEQGTGHKCDARSDIYSLGCVMYEALTGEAPFTGANAVEVILNQINSVPKPIEAKCPERKFSPALSQIVQRCIAKEPDDRYYDVATLKADLLATQAGGAQFVSKFRKQRKLGTFSKLALSGIVGGIVMAVIMSASMMLPTMTPESPWEHMANQAKIIVENGDYEKGADLFVEAAKSASLVKAPPDRVAELYTYAANAALKDDNKLRFAELGELAASYGTDKYNKVEWLQSAADHRASLNQHNQFKLALLDYESAVEILRGMPDHKGSLVAALANTGVAAFRADEFDKSKKYLEEALSMQTEKKSIGAANNYRWYGRVLAVLAKPKQTDQLRRAQDFEEMARVIYAKNSDQAGTEYVNQIENHIREKLAGKAD